jgi:hypothetical protein
MRVTGFQSIYSDQFHPPISVLIDARLKALALVDGSVQQYLNAHYTTFFLDVLCWPKIAAYQIF